MNLKEMLTEKKNALVDLEPELQAEDVSEETLAKGEALVTEIEELEKKIEASEKAAEILKKVGTKSAENIDDTEVKEMSVMDDFAKKVKEADKTVPGWAVSTQFKSASDVVKAPTIADVDRSIAPQPDRTPAASLFTNVTINGNAVTYFIQGAYEGAPQTVAQGAKKPQNSTSFTPTTLALSKIAAYIKETDEIVDDASFLASEVQNSLIYQLGSVEDGFVIEAIGNTDGIGAVEYTDFADGILEAILKVKNDSAYEASVVIVNPKDLYKFLTAKDKNGQYLGGGYFTGAYGNGGYNMPVSMWGKAVFASAKVPEGGAIVAAREAVKVYKKGGLAVKLYDQNEDDAIKNCVTLLAEERLAVAVVDLKGVVAVTNGES